jgi:chloramphenicol 3-O-phosphotransferase
VEIIAASRRPGLSKSKKRATLAAIRYDLANDVTDTSGGRRGEF